MHGSHKLWITISVFLVIVAFLLSMYFTATPDKVGAVVKKQQAAKMRQNAGQQQEVVYQDTNPQEMSAGENSLPDELKYIDLDSIKSENSDQVIIEEGDVKPDDKSGE